MIDNNSKLPATLDDVITVLQRNHEILEDIATWIKIGNIETVRKILESTIKTPEQKIVYHLSDGKTTREINASSGVSIATISRYWNMWYRLGLMKKISVRGGDRFIKKFNLEDFEIDIPQVASQKELEQKSLPVEKSITTDTMI